MLPTSNLVFLDTEFSSLDPYKGEIMSIGAVKADGSEFYIELEYEGEYDPWVKQYLLPILTDKKVNRTEAAQQLKAFVGDSKPYMVAYVNQFDTLYLHKLLGGVDQSPFFWIPIDFAAILLAYGFSPEQYYQQDEALFKKLGVDPTLFIQHNALEDARLLRQTYLKLAKQKPLP